MIILNSHAIDFAPHLFHFPFEDRGKKVFIRRRHQHSGGDEINQRSHRGSDAHFQRGISYVDGILQWNQCCQLFAHQLGENPPLTLLVLGTSGGGINIPSNTDTATNFSVTTPPSDFAPTSISGETIIFNTTQPHVATIPEMFSGLNFTDLGTNTSYGIYAWSKIDSSDGQLTQTNMEPDSDYGDISTLMLTYANVYSGTESRGWLFSRAAAQKRFWELFLSLFHRCW